MRTHMSSAAHSAATASSSALAHSASALAHPALSQLGPVPGTNSLAQTLRETEQVARRVLETRAHDLFAAAVLAEQWLQRVSRVHVTRLHTAEDKRTWAQARATLLETQRCARARTELAQKVDQYQAKLWSYARYLAAIDGDAARHTDSLVAAAERIEPEPMRVGLGISIAALAGSVIFGALTAGAPGSIILSSLSTIFFAVAWQNRAASRKAADQLVTEARARVRAYQAFMNDESGGQWLQTAWKQHPYLVEEAPSSGAPASGVRQVYVAAKQEATG